MVRENILNFDFFLSGNCLSASVWWTWEGVGGWRMRKIGQKFPIVALLVTSFSFKPSLEICPQSSCESDQCQCNSQNKKPPETETHSHKGKTAGGSPRPAVQQGQHKNVVILVSNHDGNKKLDDFRKKRILGQKLQSAIPRSPIF